MTKTTKRVLIGVSALLAVLVVFSKLSKFGKEEGKKVTAEKAEKRTIIEYVNASGKVYPEQEVKVSPEISGIITELNVEEGDSVKRGQVLARIDADQYNIQRNQAASGVSQSQAQVGGSQAQVGNAQAAIAALAAQKEQAQRNYDRLKQLFDEKVISKSELDVAEASLKSNTANYNAAQQGIKGNVSSVQSARAGVQQAQAALQRANKDLSRTVIVAPVDGVVSLLNVKKGESVAGNSFNVGTEILRIADMQKIEIRVDVGENDITKVKLGDSANITIDAYGSRKFRGVVTQIANSNNGAAGTSGLGGASNDVTQYKVYVRIIAESYADLLGKGAFPFRPGMSANADIQTKVHANVLSVPINAVTTRMPQDSNSVAATKKDEEAESTNTAGPTVEADVVVFVLQKDGTVQQRKVKTDIQDLSFIEITSGLALGEEIVSGPYESVSKNLKNKDKVKKVEKKDLFETK